MVTKPRKEDYEHLSIKELMTLRAQVFEKIRWYERAFVFHEIESNCPPVYTCPDESVYYSIHNLELEILTELIEEKRRLEFVSRFFENDEEQTKPRKNSKKTQK